MFSDRFVSLSQLLIAPLAFSVEMQDVSIPLVHIAMDVPAGWISEDQDVRWAP
jgi:hypothetical protein